MNVWHPFPTKADEDQRLKRNITFHYAFISWNIFNYLQDCAVADMCLRLLVLGLRDQATASLIETVFAIVWCVRVCISLIAQW